MAESNAEQRLLELAGMLKADTKPSEPLEVEVIEPETTMDDISDLVSKNFDRVLTNSDYLILVALDDKGIESVSAEHNVSVNYIKKLMRSNVGNEFLKSQAKQKSELALSIASVSVAEGVMKYSELVNKLFAEGKTELALSYLFGKQSLSEVQNTLHKQQAEIPEDGSNEMKSLFTSLLSDAVKK